MSPLHCATALKKEKCVKIIKAAGGLMGAAASAVSDINQSEHRFCPFHVF
jgi:hypothetical protein